MSRASSQRAFSLVELLVVMVIIVVLAGLLLPAIALAKRQTQAVQCLGNLRQLGMIIVAYAGDWDGTVLPTRCGSTMWPGTVQRYVDDQGVNRALNGCPANYAPPFGYALGYARNDSMVQERRAGNFSTDSDLGPVPNWHFFNFAQITCRSERLLVGAAFDWYMDYDGYKTYFRHSDKRDGFIFCDLHTEMLAMAPARQAITLLH